MLKNLVNPQSLVAKTPQTSIAFSKPSAKSLPNIAKQQRRVVAAENLATGELKNTLRLKREMIARKIDRLSVIENS